MPAETSPAFRNHPSMVMHMAMNEADTREQVYLVSGNFYWLRGQGTPDYGILQTLPLVQLEAASRVEDR